MTLDKKTLTLKKGDEQQLIATVKPIDAATKNVRWSSSNEGIVSVDDEGNINAISTATAKITVSSIDGKKTAFCIVTVQPSLMVTNITLNKTTATLKINEELKLIATVKPTNAENKELEWESSAPDIADVDSEGNVIAISEGKVKITAKTIDGNDLKVVNAQCEVIVVAISKPTLTPSPQSNSTSGPTITNAPGEKRTLHIELKDSEGKNISLIGSFVTLKSGVNQICSDGIKKFNNGNKLNDDILIINEYIEYSTASNDSINISISLDNGKEGYFINDKIIISNQLSGATINKIYNVSSLNCIKVDAKFLNKTTGTYSFSIFDTLNVPFSDEFKNDFYFEVGKPKNIYCSNSSITFAFTYSDIGECALISRTYNTSTIKEISFNPNSLRLNQYTYRNSQLFPEFGYYFYKIYSPFPTTLKGSLNNDGTFTFYSDSAKEASVVFSINPEAEYYYSIHILSSGSTKYTIGNEFKLNTFNIFNTYDGKEAFSIHYIDENNNNLVIMRSGIAQKMFNLEITDKTSGKTLFASEVSDYWDYFEHGLAKGTYNMKISPITKEAPYTTISYFSLSVSNGTSFATFLKSEPMQ